MRTSTDFRADKNQEASVAGSVAAAHYIRSIAPIYGVPVVLHTDHCAKSVSQLAITIEYR